MPLSLKLCCSARLAATSSPWEARATTLRIRRVVLPECVSGAKQSRNWHTRHDSRTPPTWLVQRETPLTSVQTRPIAKMSWLWEVPSHYPLPPGASFVTLPSETTRETASGNHSHYSLSYNTWHGLRLSPFCCLAGSVLIKNPCDLFILLICLCTSSSRWQFRVSGKTPLLSPLFILPCSLAAS